jgi:cytidylate kinase
MKRKIIVAIDGFSSCGKSTIAKQLARYAGYNYIDTGAMYRAIALHCLSTGEDPLTAIQHISISFTNNHILLNGEDVEDKIRTLEVGNMASRVSPIREVRQFLVTQQQHMGRDKGIVMDGRDIGTVVFPDAELKLFLTASPEVRARRRFDELKEKGEQPIWEDVLADVNERDYRDTHREESPLRQAEDAVVVDNSNLTREEQMDVIYRLFDKAVEI